MKKAKSENLLFELTQPFEQLAMQDLHNYFDWMYFAN
ncbi:MAG: hypothetical protein HLUCCX14_09835 [Marinobacter excellens HL-55]|uniref:Uncharacterized protein n=1 Tax=Marinobacter excellens HL-55 TaxID=1305731 RepID=A0A0P8CYG9_9GAMM|nr:MAG: hypothetical protein HLUCCX14_09835 [Marinobacter excellens HL-55]